MVLGLIAAIIIAFFSMFIPGVLLAYALLDKTELNHFETIVIGFHIRSHCTGNHDMA
jgi:hypothetical protein